MHYQHVSTIQKEKAVDICQTLSMAQIYITKNKAPTRNSRKCLKYMARLERFELPTNRFVAWHSIQLSYRRSKKISILCFDFSQVKSYLPVPIALTARAVLETFLATFFQCTAPLLEALAITEVALIKAFCAKSTFSPAIAACTSLIAFFIRVRCARFLAAFFNSCL